MEVYQNLIICRSLYRASIYQISGEYFKRFLSYDLDKQNPVFGHEEIPSTSKDAIGRQTCGDGGYSGAGGPFHENSSHMQTSVPRGTLNFKGQGNYTKVKDRINVTP